MSFEDDVQSLFGEFIKETMRQHNVSREAATEAVHEYFRRITEHLANGGNMVVFPPKLAAKIEKLRKSGPGPYTLDELDPELRAYVLDPRNDVTEQIFAEIVVRRGKDK